MPLLSLLLLCLLLLCLLLLSLLLSAFRHVALPYTLSSHLLAHY